jgi:hypothetical protein
MSYLIYCPILNPHIFLLDVLNYVFILNGFEPLTLLFYFVASEWSVCVCVCGYSLEQWLFISSLDCDVALNYTSFPLWMDVIVYLLLHSSIIHVPTPQSLIPGSVIVSLYLCDGNSPFFIFS